MAFGVEINPSRKKAGLPDCASHGADHSKHQKFINLYPDARIVGNNKTFGMIEQFFPNLTYNAHEVREGSVLNLGKSNLTFFNAPMIHWPEVIVSHHDQGKSLFSADAFGKFGALDQKDDWLEEARRYYFGIVGKYGVQVQMLLKKISNLPIEAICSLHGPVQKGNIRYYLDLYDTWSKYEPELKGTFIAYASMYGNTKAAAYKLYEGLRAKAGQRKSWTWPEKTSSWQSPKPLLMRT